MPEGVSSEAGFGTSMRVTVSDRDTRAWRSPSDKRTDRAGTLSFDGAANTLWVVEPARRGVIVFMTQRMPADTSIWAELHAAVDADLASLFVSSRFAATMKDRTGEECSRASPHGPSARRVNLGMT